MHIAAVETDHHDASPMLQATSHGFGAAEDASGTIITNFGICQPQATEWIPTIHDLCWEMAMLPSSVKYPSMRLSCKALNGTIAKHFAACGRNTPYGNNTLSRAWHIRPNSVIDAKPQDR
jgi:hypothetical protein